MADASYVQTSFLAGEWSKTVQGRTDRPDYRAAMNVCLNSMPMEQGAWTRRPGTQHCGTTRGGGPGRVLQFEFEQALPYSMEFTDAFLRFRNGPPLATTNDDQTIVSISSANPAKVKTGTHGWASADQVIFKNLGANNPLLQNRVFTATVTSATEFTLTDSITGDTIDGATLGTFVSGTVARVLEIATPYSGNLWSSLRAIQADIPVGNITVPGAILLEGAVKPYVLKVDVAPTATTFAKFTLEAANFKDGPYFDPVPGGTLATPSALIGVIDVTLSFAAYDATKAYDIGDYVSSGGVNYKSLVDANVGSAPPSANWVAVASSDAIGPNGFVGTDRGRMVRLYSEPPIWAVGTAYVTGNVVAYAGTYWKALANSTGVTPNTDTTKWALFSTGAIWTWGKIVALLNEIDRALAGSVNIGDLTGNGGLAAAFDGIFSQAQLQCAVKNVLASLSGYVGKNYSGASAQAIESVTVTPSSDLGIIFATLAFGTYTSTVTANLRGKATAPASASDGTLLGTRVLTTAAEKAAKFTIESNDQVTTWNYVWVEFTVSFSGAGVVALFIAVAEVQFFNPPGTGTSNGFSLQILGDPLLYTTPVRIWRLGLYSDTTGWPTCGTYHEGRLWLSGVIGNRIDSSRSNEPLNFAPTNADGSAPGNAGISYTFNAPDVNPIFWMQPDQLGIICGTQGGEWLVQATAQNLPLTPTTIQAHSYTKYNCANIEPKRTNLTLAVVQAFKRELLEYFADVYNGKFSAHDLTFTGKHLVKSGIEEIAYQQELIPVLWERCADGSLIGATYGRTSLVSAQPPDYCAWHRHTLGSGRTVESICVAGNADGTLDALCMVTNDEDTGIRHVEMLTKVFTETDALADAWLLDNAVEPSSTSSDLTPTVAAPYGGLTINGLWHVNDETVQVFAAGLDCGQGEKGTDPVDFLVTDGSVFVPYGDGTSAGSGSGLFTASFAAAAIAAGQIVVGLTYNSDGQIVRPNSPAESGARNGPAFAKKRRNTYYGLLANQCAGLSVGTSFAKLETADFKDDAGDPIAPAQTFSGIHRDGLRDDDSYDGMICWRVSRPLPATIAAIGGFLQTHDV